MAKKFENVEVGIQLELPAHRGATIYGDFDTKDPNRTVRVAIVTHIWYDPVDNKEYVALAYVMQDGSYGKPTEKRTITGLARTGWRQATRDWIANIEAEKEFDNVVNLWGRK